MIRVTRQKSAKLKNVSIDNDSDATYVAIYRVPIAEIVERDLTVIKKGTYGCHL